MLTVDKKYKAAMLSAKNEIYRRNKENEFLFYAWCTALDIDKKSNDGLKLRNYMFDVNREKIKFK